MEKIWNTEFLNQQFQHPEVVRFELSRELQRKFPCVVGDHVTADNPIFVVSKHVVKEHLDGLVFEFDKSQDGSGSTAVIEEAINVETKHEDSSKEIDDSDNVNPAPKSLSTIKDLDELLETSPLEDCLMFYIYDTYTDTDHFYLLPTEQCQRLVLKKYHEQKNLQKLAVETFLEKSPKTWSPHTKPHDITPHRKRYEITLEMKDRPRQVHLTNSSDGYLDIIRPIKDPAVSWTRISQACQVAPLQQHDVAQTYETFPQNTATQYTFDMPLNRSDPKFVEITNVGMLEDEIHYSNLLDAYADDYAAMTDIDTQPVLSLDFTEYQSFSDAKCRDYVISDTSWHPTWSGTVAVSYVHSNNAMMFNVATTSNVFPNKTPVLIWSIVDSLAPRLRCEAPYDVSTVSFCPSNENLLIGGLTNGQVIVWDVTGCLEAVEHQPIMTNVQKRNQTALTNLMKWTKPLRDVSQISATALSSLDHSHKRAVTCIGWLTPFFTITKTGQLVRGDASRTFLTGGLDGTINFWDLNVEQSLNGTVQRVSKRLQRRLSALTTDISALRAIDNLLRPVYQLLIVDVDKEPVPITCLAFENVPVNVEEVHSPYSNAKRSVFKVEAEDVETVKQQVTISTVKGHVECVKWDGYDYDPGAVLNNETCELMGSAVHHDGPVLTCTRSPFCPDILLTCGGKVVVVWHESPKLIPLMIRRATRTVTSAAWSQQRSGVFYVTTDDGNLLVWDLVNRHDTHSRCQSVSGKTIRNVSAHTLRVRILCVGDHLGTMRIFYVPERYARGPRDEIVDVLGVFERTLRRREAVELWERSLVLETTPKTHPKTLEKADEPPVKPKPGVLKKDFERFNDRLKVKFLRDQERHMNEVLLKKKGLDPSTLAEQIRPIQERTALDERKKTRVGELLARKQVIYDGEVERLIPEARIKRGREVGEGERKRVGADAVIVEHMISFDAKEESVLSGLDDFLC